MNQQWIENFMNDFNIHWEYSELYYDIDFAIRNDNTISLAAHHVLLKYFDILWDQKVSEHSNI